MKKEITFKRRTVEFVGCGVLLIAFIAVLFTAYYIFLYTPPIKNIPYVDPRESNK